LTPTLSRRQVLDQDPERGALMLRLRDIMTTDVVTVSPEVTVRDAMVLFSSRHVSGAPVVANGKVVAVVSSTDLMEFAGSLPGIPTAQPEPGAQEEWEASTEGMEEDEAPQAYFADRWDDAGADVAERMGEVAGPEWNALEEHTVGEAMTRTIFSLPPGTAVNFAALRMRETGVHRVLVMQGEQLVGIVTTKDISDAVADHKLAARTDVFSP
jgi:CBS domain-containing protein